MSVAITIKGNFELTCDSIVIPEGGGRHIHCVNRQFGVVRMVHLRRPDPGSLSTNGYVRERLLDIYGSEEEGEARTPGNFRALLDIGMVRKISINDRVVWEAPSDIQERMAQIGSRLAITRGLQDALAQVLEVVPGRDDT